MDDLEALTLTLLDDGARAHPLKADPTVEIQGHEIA